MALTKEHLIAIDALVSGDSAVEASAKSGIPIQTLYNYTNGKRLPEFRFELDRREKKIDEAIRSLHKGNKRMCLEIIRDWLFANKSKKGSDTVKRSMSILNALGKSGPSVEIGSMVINMSPEERIHEFNRLKRLTTADGLGIPEAQRN